LPVSSHYIFVPVNRLDFFLPLAGQKTDLSKRRIKVVPTLNMTRLQVEESMRLPNKNLHKK